MNAPTLPAHTSGIVLAAGRPPVVRRLRGQVYCVIPRCTSDAGNGADSDRMPAARPWGRMACLTVIALASGLLAFAYMAVLMGWSAAH